MHANDADASSDQPLLGFDGAASLASPVCPIAMLRLANSCSATPKYGMMLFTGAGNERAWRKHNILDDAPKAHAPDDTGAQIWLFFLQFGGSVSI